VRGCGVSVICTVGLSCIWPVRHCNLGALANLYAERVTGDIECERLFDL
jgi:hypothetical protein